MKTTVITIKQAAFRKHLLTSCLALIIGFAQQAMATEDDQLSQLKTQMEQMQTQIEALEKKLAEQEQEQTTIMEKASSNEEPVARSEQQIAERPRAVQVYGQARLSLDHRSGDGWGTKGGTELVSNASRLGVKGEVDTALEDTAMFYTLEIRYETADYVNGGPGSDEGTRQLEPREGFGGLKGGWGKLRLGRLQTEYKKTMTTIDPWNDNAPEADKGGRQGASEIHAGYANNALDYVTPEFFGGLTASGWYATRFHDSTKPIDNTSTLKDFVGGKMWGVGAKWKSGPLLLAADYIKIDAETIKDPGLGNGLNNGDGWQIAGRYIVEGVLSMAALYEDVESIGLGRNIMVNGIYTLDRYHVIGTYGQNRSGRVYGNDDWNNGSLGVKYDLTRHSELLAAWNHGWNDTTNQDYDTFTVGINAKFGY